MSSTDRQNKLLIAEDWKKIYQTFRNADFQSYDFENLRRTMIDYIRQNYPEDYNDYIESSEYLALIDLIAFLGQSIAFRVDLNARENFLELAERRESVLRLARMLSYNAKRNIPAQGLLKFTTVSTTQSVIDSNGRNLAGQVIAWNDASNANWYDQFIKVINAAMSTTQQFGNPENSDTVNGIYTEQYRFQASNTDVPLYGFSKSIDGRSMPFEVTSTSFKGQNFIYEEAPKVGNKLGFVYRDDNRGTASPTSGFFLNFVQGTLNTGAFTITQPSTNESIDIAANNINNNDVWLYRLDKNDAETELWSQVSTVEGNNVIYNSINKNIKSIYSVITKANDTVSLSFSDGTFGSLPLGSFRVYYRVSNGLEYTINAQDIRNVAISIPYTSNTGQAEELTVTLNLASSVSNATATESNTSIKANAPATYYTQNRMITGEDYNISPLSVTQQVAKVKAVNRTSSGVSRYFDLVDPTGKYSSTNLFADDGVLYKEEFTNNFRFSYLNKTEIEGIIYNAVYDVLADTNVKNYYYSKYQVYVADSLQISWYAKTTDSGSSSGYIGAPAPATTIYKVGTYTVTDLKYFKPGALVKFTAPAGHYFDTTRANKLVAGTATVKGSASDIWAEVVSVSGDGTGAGTGVLTTGFGPITLNQSVPTNAIITQIIPTWRTSIDTATVALMVDLIFANKQFGLRYDAVTQTWKIVFESNLDSTSIFSLGKEGDSSNQRQDASWLVLFTTDNEFYTVTSRQLRYVFESDTQIRFYFDKSNKIYDSKTNSIITDKVKLLSINSKPDDAASFTTDMDWDIVAEFHGLDGYVDNKKLVIAFADTDSDGVVDNPELFSLVVAPPALTQTSHAALQPKYIILEKYNISVGQEDYKYVPNKNNTDYGIVYIAYSEDDIGAKSQYPAGQYFYFVNTDTVKQLDSLKSNLIPTLDYKVYIGRDNLKFQYTHSADYESRIDPGTSNLIDIFVLSRSYDVKFRQWLAGNLTTKPLPPSSDELYNNIAPSLNLIKSISDEIIYHPANYKVLFGPQAVPELQATFKITKNAGQVLSDNDIKARAIAAINRFFDLENWDFGDTFYFTELSTYVMTQLAPDITNFVIVPRSGKLNFGSLFEIKSTSDELFINGASVNDIEIISGITSSTIKSVSGTNVDTTTITQNVTSSTYGSN